MKDENILYAIQIEDVQEEAKERLGRTLTEDELGRTKKLLSESIGFNLDFIYPAIFEEFSND